MTFRALISVMVVVVAGSVARADDGFGFFGFMTYGAGELSGSVVDENGTPQPGADVHLVLGAAPERIVKAGADGKFKVAVTENGTSWIYVRFAKIRTPTLVASDGTESIVEIHEAIPPAVQAQSLARPFTIPPYSDEAMDRNYWTRAWLVLDIDKSGTVQRLKVLNRPGMGLEPIAIREAFAMRFQPARDRSGQPMGTLVIWVFEWPAYLWLTEHGSPRTIPARAVGAVPCRLDGTTRTTYRDCTSPALGSMNAEPWIDRPKK